MVENFGLRAIPPGATIENIKLDNSAKKRVIDGVATNISEYYVYPETPQKMIASLRTHEQHGDYNAVTDSDAFAGLLTRQLQDVSQDKHLRVNYSPFKLPPDQHGPSAEEEA